MGEKVLMKGNEAIAEAAIRAGCRAYFAYPITPQNELVEYMARRMPEVGGVFLQCESELAAINMVFGAAAAGARAMTSSSGPGISLKQEGISYLAGAELPCFYVNMARGGPGLGNIAPSQSDYFQATRGGGHGDYRVIVLAPNSVEELADLTAKGFYLADKYRNPTMILGDGLLGQMSEPMEFRESVLPELPPKDWAVGVARGRKRNVITSVYLEPGVLERHNWHLHEKYCQIAAKEVMYEETDTEGADSVIVAYGTSARIARAALNLGKSKGLKIGLIRPITLWPFPTEFINTVARDVENFMVVEMSLGQMIDDVKIAVEGLAKVTFLGRPGGGVPTPQEILNAATAALAGRRFVAQIQL